LIGSVNQNVVVSPGVLSTRVVERFTLHDCAYAARVRTRWTLPRSRARIDRTHPVVGDPARRRNDPLANHARPIADQRQSSGIPSNDLSPAVVPYASTTISHCYPRRRRRS
jgi:hypothetical protein